MPFPVSLQSIPSPSLYIIPFNHWWIFPTDMLETLRALAFHPVHLFIALLSLPGGSDGESERSCRTNLGQRRDDISFYALSHHIPFAMIYRR